MNSYLYCIARGDDLDPLAAPPGIGGAPVKTVKTVKADSLMAVVSEFAGPAIAPTREDATAHHRVVEAVLRKTTPIPCRFGAILKTDSVSEFLTANSEKFLGLLAVFSGRIEMDIKITPGPSPESDVRFEEHLDETVGEGTRYFMKKKMEHAAERSRLEAIGEVQTQVIRLFDDLSAEVRKFVHQNAAAGEVAHLIERGAIDRYRARFVQVSNGLARVRLALSGPWAPYSFVPDIKILRPEGIHQNGSPESS